MSQILTGVTALVQGSDVLVLAEIISSIDFEALQAANPGRQISISEDQFDTFIARQGRSFMDSGLLNEEFQPTNKVAISLQ